CPPWSAFGTENMSSRSPESPPDDNSRKSLPRFVPSTHRANNGCYETYPHLSIRRLWRGAFPAKLIPIGFKPTIGACDAVGKNRLCDTAGLHSARENLHPTGCQKVSKNRTGPRLHGVRRLCRVCRRTSAVQRHRYPHDPVRRTHSRS